MPCTLTCNEVLPVNSAEAEAVDVAVWADEAGSVNEEWFRGVCEGCCSVMVSLAVAKDSNPHYQGSACKSQVTATTKDTPNATSTATGGSIGKCDQHVGFFLSMDDKGHITMLEQYRNKPTFSEQEAGYN